ncbi:MAG: FISUMP domain-containing protein [bacterium]
MNKKRFIGFAEVIALFIAIITGTGCNKEPGDEVNDLYGTWTDTVDGTVYRTLQLGDQLWMVDNINRGQIIDGSRDQEDNGVIDKYCYDNNPVLCDQYGGLYQWEEAMQYETSESSRGICPAGWHIPSDSEWKILELFLGMPGEVAGDEFWRGIDQGMKIQPGGETGFEALRGGNRFLNGEFHQIGNMGYFWTSTRDEASHAWRRGVGLDEDGIYRSVNHKSFGFSVRCVRY